MALINAAAVILATIFAVLAVVFGIASSMSLGATDPKERKDATISAFWSLFMFAACAAAILSLTGCQAAKTIIDTCRDGLCR